MTRSATWSIRVAAMLAISAGVAWVVWPRPVGVDIALVERATLQATVTAEGKTRVKDLFTVAAPVDGERERITLKAGDVVHPSSVVARMWPVAPRPLDVRSRAEAVAAVTSARAAVERGAEATQKEAAGALAHAESTFNTTKRLATDRVVASNDLEHAGHELEIRRQALEASRAALEVARAELQRAEAAAAVTTTPSGRALTQVRSPIAGRVLRVLHESAGPVTAGTPILEIGDITNIEIAADFLTTDAMAVQPGAAAMIRDWGDGPPIAARVRRIDPAAFTKVSPLGLEEQRVTVVLDLVEPRPVTFGHDYHVNVAVVVWTGDEVLTVPSTALFRVGDDWAVMGVRKGTDVELTIACAFISRHVRDVDEYVRLKARVQELALHEARGVGRLQVSAVVNAADAPEHGDLYLTVTGTSAESGDDGEVGRGNRASGLITPYRPMTMEAVAGKNPVTHVGKLYNLLASRMAADVVTGCPGVRGAECVLVSGIGRSISDPRLVDLCVTLESGVELSGVQSHLRETVVESLSHLPDIRDAVLQQAVSIA